MGNYQGIFLQFVIVFLQTTPDACVTSPLSIKDSKRNLQNLISPVTSTHAFCLGLLATAMVWLVPHLSPQQAGWVETQISKAIYGPGVNSCRSTLLCWLLTAAFLSNLE